jgi:hypothetical protein
MAVGRTPSIKYLNLDKLKINYNKETKKIIGNNENCYE